MSKSSQKKPRSADANAGKRNARRVQRIKRSDRKVSEDRSQERAGPRAAAGGKISIITTLLRRPKGASIADLCKSTGWQAHSVRGAISASVKKKLGLKVSSTKVDGVRIYRVVA